MPERHQKPGEMLYWPQRAQLNLHAISRHSDGASRINVGSLVAGSGRNIIGDKAVLKLETRGATSKINQYMAGEALRIIKAAAAMYDVKIKIREVGSAAGGSNTPELSKKVQMVAERLAIFDDIVPTADFGASEDFSYYMERVQEKGGQAAYMMVGADLAAGHHDSYFDFDETALDYAAKLLSSVTAQLLTDKFIEKVATMKFQFAVETGFLVFYCWKRNFFPLKYRYLKIWECCNCDDDRRTFYSYCYSVFFNKAV